MQTLKLCCNKIIQFLTGVSTNTGWPVQRP